jgi:hypothetical protein
MEFIKQKEFTNIHESTKKKLEEEFLNLKNEYEIFINDLKTKNYSNISKIKISFEELTIKRGKLYEFISNNFQPQQNPIVNGQITYTAETILNVLLQSECSTYYDELLDIYKNFLLEIKEN